MHKTWVEPVSSNVGAHRARCSCGWKNTQINYTEAVKIANAHKGLMDNPTLLAELRRKSR